MPRLDEARDLLAGYDVGSDYISIPGSSDLVGELAAAGVKSAAASFALQDFRSFASVAQIVTSRQAALVGVPSWIAPSLGTFFSKIPLVSDGRSLAEGVVDGVAKLVDGALEGAATAVPIIGAIVRMGISIFKLVRDEIAAEQSAGPRPPDVDQAMVYDMGADTLEGNLIANIAGGSDWTELFLPPSNDPRFALQGVARAAGTVATGLQWYSHRDLGWGLLPGIGDQLGVYQMAMQDGYVNPFAALHTRGTFRPSGPKFATVLWQSAMKPSIQMFMMDSHAIEDAWSGYFDGLWKFSNAESFGSQFDANETEALRWAIRRSASYGKLYGCADEIEASKRNAIADCRGKTRIIAKESTVKAFPVSKLQKQLGELTWLYSDIVRYVCQLHRQRAASALGTLVVAYVPSDAPLLKADDALAELHRSMRAALLDHPARYDVELDLVPTATADDAEWRSDLVRSRIVANVGLRAGTGTPAKDGKPPKIPGESAPPPPPPPPPGIPANGASTDASGGAGVALAVVGGVAAVGLGVALARR